MKKLLLVAALISVIGCDKTNTDGGKGPSTVPPINQSMNPPPPAPPPTEMPVAKDERHGDTTITPTGLKYIDMKVGKGEQPKPGQTIIVNYTGKLTNGTTFDSNVDPKFGHTQPFITPIGVGKVIPGWDEGMVSMKVGGKRRLIVPSELGYGPQGSGDKIPPNSTLIFDVELIKVQ